MYVNGYISVRFHKDTFYIFCLLVALVPPGGHISTLQPGVLVRNQSWERFKERNPCCCVVLLPVCKKWLHCTYCEQDVMTAFLLHHSSSWWWCLSVFDRNVPVGSWTRKLSRPFTHSSSLKEVKWCHTKASACKEWSVWNQCWKQIMLIPINPPLCFICCVFSDATMYAHFLFNAFDMDRSGSIRFEVIWLGSASPYLSLLCQLLMLFDWPLVSLMPASPSHESLGWLVNTHSSFLKSNLVPKFNQSDLEHVCD